MRVRGWMPLALLLIPAASALADTFVIAVGVEQYDDLRVSSLRYAIADAKAVAGTFRASGVPFDHVTVLTSEQRAPDRRPSRVRVLTALEDVAERAKAGDTLVFFFAGHGIEQEGEQYLMTADTRRSLVAETALPMKLLGKALSGIGASNVLFILDACRNDPDSGRGDRDAPLTDGLARGLRPMLAEQGGPAPHVATLLSCDVGQRAWEDPGQGHGAFTVYLLKALRGAAGSPVTLKSLSDYVTRETSAWAKRAKREQSPKLLNPDAKDMQLLTPPAEPMVSVSFQNDTLAKVVDVLGEQYGVPIVVGRGVDAESKVTGHLDNQPLSVTLKVLLKAHDLSVQRDGDVYVILPPGQTVAPPAPKEEAYQVIGDELVVDQQNGPYKTIGEAVKAAKPNATVLVKPGTYREQVVIDRPLTVVGEGGAEKVTLSSAPASRDDAVVTVAAGPSTIQDITVKATSPSTSDGPIAVRADADATLSRLRLSSTGMGAGCSTFRGRVELRECQVDAFFGVTPHGPGEAILVRCFVVSRHAGLRVEDGGTAAAKDCRFVGGSHAVQANGVCRVSLSRCDLAVAAQGAFLVSADGTVVHTDCVFDPSDPTVSISVPAPIQPKSFRGERIKVDQAGGADFRTLSEAVRAASPGATILVSPGRYQGRLFVTKPLTIEGVGEPDNVVLEAAGMEALIVVGAEVTLRKVSIWSPRASRRVRGSGTVAANYGSTIHFDRCIVRNVDPAARAAVFQSLGAVSLKDCVVAGGPTAGVWCGEGSARLTNCTVTGSDGAGLRLRDGARATVTGCDLRGNGKGPFDVGSGCTLEQTDNQLGR